MPRLSIFAWSITIALGIVACGSDDQTIATITATSNNTSTSNGTSTTTATSNETCDDACDEGLSLCGDTIVQVCERDASGCLVWTLRSCQENEMCSALGGFAECVANEAPCEDACELGAEQCNAVGDGNEKCKLSDEGCAFWAADLVCSDGWRCEVRGESTACINIPCEDMCEEGSARCNEDEGLEQCQPDAEGCLDWTTMVCPAGELCEASDEGAACVAETCENVCSFGASRCGEDGSIENCRVGDNGCNAWLPMSCAEGQVCEDLGDGTRCVVGCLPRCEEGANHCLDDSVESCVVENNCADWAITDVCSDEEMCVEALSGAQCTGECADVCVLTIGRCNANGDVELCTVGEGGCAEWTETDVCSDGEGCQEDANTAFCLSENACEGACNKLSECSAPICNPFSVIEPSVCLEECRADPENFFELGAEGVRDGTCTDLNLSLCENPSVDAVCDCTVDRSPICLQDCTDNRFCLDEGLRCEDAGGDGRLACVTRRGPPADAPTCSPEATCGEGLECFIVEDDVCTQGCDHMRACNGLICNPSDMIERVDCIEECRAVGPNVFGAVDALEMSCEEYNAQACGEPEILTVCRCERDGLLDFRCLYPCETDADCAGNLTCEDWNGELACLNRGAVPTEARDCASNGVCADTRFTCTIVPLPEGLCVPICRLSEECAPGLLCTGRGFEEGQRGCVLGIGDEPIFAPDSSECANVGECEADEFCYRFSEPE